MVYIFIPINFVQILYSLFLQIPMKQSQFRVHNNRITIIISMRPFFFLVRVRRKKKRCRTIFRACSGGFYWRLTLHQLVSVVPVLSHIPCDVIFHLN